MLYKFVFMSHKPKIINLNKQNYTLYKYLFVFCCIFRFTRVKEKLKSSINPRGVKYETFGRHD